MNEFLETLRQSRVIGIVRADSAEAVGRDAAKMMGGGVGIAEVSWTTPDAGAVVEELRSLGQAWIGAGTITNVGEARAAVAAGAQFLIAPNYSRDVQALAEAAGVLYIPGVWTAQEVAVARSAGLGCVKLFPASTGGIPHLKALRDPFPEMLWIPTGGVTSENALSWLDAGAFALGMGSGLSKLSPDELAGFVARVRARAQ